MFERVEVVEYKNGHTWDKLGYGIGRHEYNQHDSDRNITSHPIEKYVAYENNQIEFFGLYLIRTPMLLTVMALFAYTA